MTASTNPDAPHQLIRLDDNGNQFTVGTYPTLAEAQAMLDRLASGGHKQTYWCEPVGGAPASGPEAEIRRLRAASNAAIAAHDAKAAASFVEDDVQITTGNGDKFQGRKAMRERFAEHFRGRPDLVFVRTPEQILVSSCAPLASERGDWVGRWTEGGRVVEIRGVYQAMWRQRGGQWRIAAELFVLLEEAG